MMGVTRGRQSGLCVLTMRTVVGKLMLLALCVFLSLLDGSTAAQKQRQCAKVCSPMQTCVPARQQKGSPWCVYSEKSQRYVKCCKERRPPGAVAVKMCKKYKSYVFDTLASTYVVGGLLAHLGEFTHVAMIGYGDKEKIRYDCGGSLISPKFVLTAAHCMKKELPRWVLLGDLDPTITTPGEHPQLLEIRQIIRHEKFKVQQHYNDIALLKLRKPARLTKYVRPACLYVASNRESRTSFNRFNGSLLATGWGVINEAGDRSNALLKVQLPIQPQSVCADVFSASRRLSKLPSGIFQDSQFCAGGFNTGKDTCGGDSGGPLQFFTSMAHSNLINHIVGITSFSRFTCGSGPSVYTSVNAYLQWIEDKVWP